jgi:hypothetical protein
VWLSNIVKTNPNPPPASLLDRFDLIIAILVDIVATQGFAARIAQPRLMLVWQRLTRLAGRFTRAAIRGPIQNRLPRSIKNRAPKPKPAKPAYTLPNGFGWLLRLLPGTKDAPAALIYPAQQLRDLLADPAMANLIETNPTIGRALRPLFNALGLERPAILEIPQPELPASQPANPDCRAPVVLCLPPLPFQPQTSPATPAIKKPAI